MRFLVALLLAAAIGPLTLLPAQAASLNSRDAGYLTSSMQTQLGRYALASLAQKNASSSKVKALARSIADDSAHNIHRLTALAKRFGVPPAKGPDVRASYHYAQLSNLHGAAFDKRFVQDLQIGDSVSADRHAVEVQKGSNNVLKDYAKSQSAALKHEQKKLAGISQS